MSGKSGAAEASKMIASILSRSEGSARRTAQVLAEARLSSAALGAQLSNVLRPVGKQLQHHQQQQQQQQQHQQQQEQRHHDEDNSRFSSRECEVFSAFWEHTGVVMLEPEVPKPDELVQRFVPALDNFLAASSINVFEEVDRASDPRKFSFVSKGREMRDAFCSEVVAVVSLCRQFEDALAALLATQKQIRAVSDDEHILKANWMHERFARLLESLLEKTRKNFVALQKNFLSVYPENSTARSLRLQSNLRMEDDLHRVERNRNPNFAAKKVNPSKRRPVDALDDADTWMESCVSLAASLSVEDAPRPALQTIKQENATTASSSFSAKPARKKKGAAAAPTKHRSRSSSPSSASFPSSEDGSSEVVNAVAPVMIAVKKLRVDHEQPKQMQEQALFENCAPPTMSECLFSLDDDMCLGPMSMVLYDEGLLPEGIF